MQPEPVCPIYKIANIFSDQWTILIVRDILASPKRFCELEKSLTGISSRTLTIKLQKLVENDILEHPKLHYRITKKGSILKPIIREMEKAGMKF